MAEISAYPFKPHERLSMVGAPANPDHPAGRRAGYFAVGCLIGITGGLGNALITVNLSYAQGDLGLYADEGAWLTAAYFMTSVSANLLLVKFRQQFGLQRFLHCTLGVYASATMLHLLVHDLWTAIAIRALSGISAAGLTTLTILYLMQSMPAPKRLTGIMIGICIPQLATPLARTISPHLLEMGDWHMLYYFELGMVLATLAAVLTLPLPPSERRKVFESVDALTFVLLAIGLSLLIAVLSEGRILWWEERAWLGWALVAALGLIGAGLIVEHGRANPLIHTRWLATHEVVRLVVVAASVRVLLSEQAFGSIGLLNAVGLINDQMVLLNLIVGGASILGIVVAVKTFNPNRLGWPIALAVALIAIASYLDAGSDNLTRPANLYVTQALIGFASLLFLAQAQVIGTARTLLAGNDRFVSFVVIFGISQNVGGLLGNALLGTLQTVREKFHSHELVQRILVTDPLVAGRFRTTADSLMALSNDSAVRNATGADLLAQQVTREANILAYNDVFLAISVFAVVMLMWEAWIHYTVWRTGETSPVILLQRKVADAGTGKAEAR